MNKKLLATAMGIALAGAMSSANASVKIYGYLNGSYDFYNNSTSATANGAGTSSSSAFSSNSSHFGLKGSEDLGGGNAFIWQVESGFDLNGGGSLATRNTFGGFTGDWGTVIAGKHDSAMKMADTSVMPFNNTISDSRNIMGSNDGTDTLNLRPGHVVAYVSPNLMGLHAYAIYVGSQSTGHGLSNTKDGAYDLAANYKNGPIDAWVAYEDQRSSYSNNDLKAVRVSGSYDFNPFKVGAIYEHESTGSNYGTDNPYGVAGLGARNAWGVFGLMNMGMNTVGVAYYKADSMNNTSNTGADMWTLAAYHHFTKRTDVYAEYASMNNDANASYSLGGGGHGELIKPTVAGKNPSAFSIGFEHKF